MRVITGSAKGHRLKAPKGMGTRPMLDRVKESLFSVIESYGPIRGRVLDLFAGTGSLGIECLSRGATRGEFVEQSAHVCKIITENLTHTRLIERAKVHNMPVARFLRTHQTPEAYDIIVMDPPYADPHIQDIIATIGAAEMIAREGILVVGHSPRVTLADAYAGLRRRRFRKLGDSCFSIYERANADSEDDQDTAVVLEEEDAA